MSIYLALQLLVMFLVRLLFVMLLSVSMISLVQASGRPKVPTIAATEARSETATPAFQANGTMPSTWPAFW
jgi:hypothetical protein